MDWKKLGKALLFPHAAVTAILIPTATAALVFAMLYLDESSPLRIAAYVLSFYTLTVVCVRVPDIIAYCKKFKNTNKYVKLWSGDVRLRMKITLGGTVLWNCGYAFLQLGIGIYHGSAWFYSLAAYYFSLALMRAFLAQYTFRYKPGERMRDELKRYRICGCIFLLMNLALSGMMFYMIRGDRVVRHNEITTITLAAYTFASFTMAIVNVVRYRKFNSPVFSASKAISLAAACVSVMTLENTMLYTFNNETMTAQTHRLFMALTGAAIAGFIILMAVYMIVRGSKQIKFTENENG